MSGPDRGAGTSLSGWCLSGYCLPGPYTRGCPGTFETVADCTCGCHRGDVPDRATRTLEAQHRWEQDGTLAAFDPSAGPEVA